MQDILNALIPVFLMIALGFALRRVGFLAEDTIRHVNRVCFWVGMPALLFYKLAVMKIDLDTIGRPQAAMLAGTAICIAAGYLASWTLRAPKRSTGALVQAGYRGNLAFVGLTVLILMHGDGPAVTLAVVLLGLTVPIYNIVAVIVLSAGLHEGKRPAVNTLKTVAGNPLLLSCLTGVAWSFWGPALPVWASRTLEPVGQMALPMALLGVGGVLHWDHLKGRRRLVMAAGLIKCALGPLAGWALARAMGLNESDTQVVMVYLACPAAAASFIMSQQMGADPALASGAVALSTVLAFPTLALVLMWT